MSSQWFGQHGAQQANADQIPALTNILKDCSAEFLGQLRTWLEQNPPAIPVTQILGFSQFTAQADRVSNTASESTVSTTYTDLATVGPRLTGLPDGKYLVVFGAGAQTSVAGIGAVMSISVNGATPVDADGATVQSASIAGGTSAVLKTLSSGGNNTLSVQYRIDGAATGGWLLRWLIALRYANA